MRCQNCKRALMRKANESLHDFEVRKFCGRECFFKYNVGEHSTSYKGGFKTDSDGYIKETRSDQYVHRLVMEKHLGRKLKNSEHIHHKDGNPGNNNIRNLVICSNSEHRILEAKKLQRGKDGKWK